MKRREEHNVVELVDEILNRALARNASDIHFEPTDTCLLVRLRVDGQLLEFESLPARLAENVVARLKVLGSLLTYRVDIPQEGSLRWQPGVANPRVGGEPTGGLPVPQAIDLRIATFPTIRGERAVVRVFQAWENLQSLDSLGLLADQADILRAAVEQPVGMIVSTGPAGSGKTTTLYAMIRHLRDRFPQRSVITLEDPVEQRIDRVTQIQINPHGELSYERCLRSLLRQDPQVLLIGEIRDQRTADVVIEAALTGHLILTTVHSGDPAEAIVRFLEMGIAPYQLVSTLTVVCSQRLLRKTCLDCEPGSTTPCPACQGTGFSGRTAIGQVVRIDEAVRRLILKNPTASELRDVLKLQGPDLREHADALVRDGVTSDGEVQRVLG